MQRVKNILSKTGRAIGIALAVLLSISFIEAGFNGLVAPPPSPQNIHVAKVTGTLAAYPEINSYAKYANIKLTLNEYPHRNFKLDGSAFYASKWGIINDYVIPGDTVLLEVSADDYERNIVHYEPTEYTSQVAVYSFRSKGQDFLTLDAYCKEERSYGGIPVGVLIFGCLLLFGLCFGLWKEWKEKQYKK